MTTTDTTFPTDAYEALRDLVNRLQFRYPAAKFSFGYIGNCDERHDDRGWYIWRDVPRASFGRGLPTRHLPAFLVSTTQDAFVRFVGADVYAPFTEEESRDLARYWDLKPWAVVSAAIPGEKWYRAVELVSFPYLSDDATTLLVNVRVVPEDPTTMIALPAHRLRPKGPVLGPDGWGANWA